MAQEELVKIQEQLRALERRMRPLEWDLSRNQINEFRRAQLDKFKQEHQTLSSQIQELQK